MEETAVRTYTVIELGSAGEQARHCAENIAPMNKKASSAETRQIQLTANRLDARDLFLSSREITITHGDETYRLRLTAQNKLILTK